MELLLDVLVVNLRYLILLWVRTPARQHEFIERTAERPLPGDGFARSCTASPTGRLDLFADMS